MIVSVNRMPVNSVAEFDEAAANAKGSTLLKIIHQGQAIFVVVPPEGGDSD